MLISLFSPSQTTEVIALFKQTFTDAEGVAEGETIAELVTDMLNSQAVDGLIGVVAMRQSKLIGAILFSPMTLSVNRVGYLLSPVAVCSDEQGKGVGQTMINWGLKHLSSQDVDWVFTYGDPAFYQKVGFTAVSETKVQAPQPLSFPEGWIGQSLSGKPIEAAGETANVITSGCIAPLNKPALW